MYGFLVKNRIWNSETWQNGIELFSFSTVSALIFELTPTPSISTDLHAYVCTEYSLLCTEYSVLDSYRGSTSGSFARLLVYGCMGHGPRYLLYLFVARIDERESIGMNYEPIYCAVITTWSVPTEVDAVIGAIHFLVEHSL